MTDQSKPTLYDRMRRIADGVQYYGGPHVTSALERLGQAASIFGPQADIVGYQDGGVRSLEAIGRGEYGEAAKQAGYAGLSILGMSELAKLGMVAAPAISSRASRTAMLYDAPSAPLRQFADDYPEVAPHDEAGRLTRTIDGDALTAPHVVGRTEVGGGDVALPREVLDEIAKAGTGHAINAAPQSSIGRDVGRVTVNRLTRVPTAVGVDARLPPDKFDRVAYHEIGHVLDQWAGEIPSGGLSVELRKIYNDLNNPTPRGRGKQFGPETGGYKGEDVDRELMSEALRAYMTNPNYIKSVAPNVARRIRDYINSHPNISKTVQFNSIAALLAGGGSYLMDQSEQPENGQMIY